MLSEREKILQMVADGTITTEEANRLLECLDILVENNEAAAMQEETQEKETSETVDQPQGAPAVEVEPVQEPQGAGQQENAYAQSVASEMVLGDYKSSETVTADINSIDISWISGDIMISRYQGDVINVIEYSKYAIDEEDRMDIYQLDGVLKIKWDKRVDIFSLAMLKRLITRPFLSKQLVIEIPEKIADKMGYFKCNAISSKLNISGISAGNVNLSTTSGRIDGRMISAQTFKASSTSGKVVLDGVNAENVKVDTTSGGANISNVQAQTVKVDAVSGSTALGNISADTVRVEGASGKIKVDMVQCNHLRVDTVSGSLSVLGTAQELNCSTISGKIIIELGNCPDNSKFSSTSGRIDLCIPDNDGFSAKYTSVSGRFASEFPVMMDGSNSNGNAVYKSGGASFKFNTVSGSMSVKRIG